MVLILQWLIMIDYIKYSKVNVLFVSIIRLSLKRDCLLIMII